MPSADSVHVARSNSPPSTWAGFYSIIYQIIGLESAHKRRVVDFTPGFYRRSATGVTPAEMMAVGDGQIQHLSVPTLCKPSKR